MAETTTGVDTTDLSAMSDEDVNKAMAEAFDAENDHAEIEAEPQPEPKPKAKPSVEDDEDEPKVTFEDVQKIRREQGNDRRERQEIKKTLTELTEMVKGLRPTTERQVDAKDESLELITRAQKLVTNGSVDPETGELLTELVKRLGRPNAPDLKGVREQLQEIVGNDHDLQDARSERLFNKANPELAGRYQELSDRAWEIVEEESSEGDSVEAKQAAANFALRRIVKTLKARHASKPKAASANTTDKTAKAKPAGSTKGAQTVTSSAAPSSKDDLANMTDEQIEEMVARGYNNDAKGRRSE